MTKRTLMQRICEDVARALIDCSLGEQDSKSLNLGTRAYFDIANVKEIFARKHWDLSKSTDPIFDATHYLTIQLWDRSKQICGSRGHLFSGCSGFREIEPYSGEQDKPITYIYHIRNATVVVRTDFDRWYRAPVEIIALDRIEIERARIAIQEDIEVKLIEHQEK